MRSIGYRLGSTPEQTPAWTAVELSLQRTFGRWQLQPLDSAGIGDAGRSSVLIEALAARLRLRQVRPCTPAARSPRSAWSTAE